jgi:hypothetical protein
LSATDAGIAPSSSSDRPGESYAIRIARESSEEGSNGSSGSSSDRDTIIERVIAVRADGLELEYDLPKELTREERASSWQFPARVFKPSHGPLQLLNGPELRRRVDEWLKNSKIPRAACGHWIFTWNAFQIECDPQSVIKTLELIDLSLRDGAVYHDDKARTPAQLIRKGALTLAAELEVDPNAVRRDRAQSDVIVGEIMKKPVTLDTALRKREKGVVSGTISVTIDEDAAGNPWRRTKVTKVRTKAPNGDVQTEIVTETIERRPLSSTSS